MPESPPRGTPVPIPHRTGGGPARVGPVVTVPESHRIVGRFKSPDPWQPASLGVAVTLPEWTMNAAASALALNTAHTP